MKSLEKTTESLVFAYLVANLNFKNTPLKEFMDGFEKKILLACLRLTHGSQKNAAEVLGLKPTALFGKMRKHCINGRQIKLSEKLEVTQPQEMEGKPFILPFPKNPTRGSAKLWHHKISRK